MPATAAVVARNPMGLSQGAAAANLQQVGSGWLGLVAFGMPPGFGPCHNTSLRTFDFPSAARAPCAAAAAAAGSRFVAPFLRMTCSFLDASILNIFESRGALVQEEPCFSISISFNHLCHIGNHRCSCSGHSESSLFCLLTRVGLVLRPFCKCSATLNFL